VPGSQLSRKQEQAIAALLELPTIDRAADKVGVSEKTLRNWLKVPEFLTAYRDARRQVVEESVALLQRLAAVGVTALHRNLTCGKPAVEVSAACAILDRSLRGVELLDLVERVEELERRAQEQKDGRGVP
jgi:hypothetical protein